MRCELLGGRPTHFGRGCGQARQYTCGGAWAEKRTEDGGKKREEGTPRIEDGGRKKEEPRKRTEDGGPRQDLRTKLRAATETSGLAGFGLASVGMLFARRA